MYHKLFGLCFCLLFISCGGDSKRDVTDYADPTIGGVSVLLETL